MMGRVLALVLLGSLPGAGEAPWTVFYDREAGFVTQPTGAWIGPGTSSHSTPEGLRITDASSQANSGRLYELAWQLDPTLGAAVEVRLQAHAASEPWGSCVNVADGLHEEDISFFPDQVVLSYAKLRAPFRAGDGLHTYRIELKAPDIRVWADDRLLLDGTGRFTHGVIAPRRNRLAFGASASTATSDTTWQQVRFRGGRLATAETPLPQVPGLLVTRGETVMIRDGVRFTNLFRFANGLLQVGDRRSSDGGRTWQPGSGPWVGACQLPDGEVIALDYRTHAAGQTGWFVSDLARWDADGRALPKQQARLHVPDLVPFKDDDGSVRDGPWCDHAIVLLRDGSLLAANCGCFAQDRTPVTSYPKEFGAFKYRGFVTRSTDRGRTWEYLATVTADPTLGSEGCNEMDLVRAPNGDLLCVYRTGGSATQPSPLYQCRSRDEGRTWGPPQRVADRGVWPNSTVTGDGIIVCTYGRPGNWLCYSVDSGATWVGHHCFWSGPTTAYNSVEEVAPGRVLVMYDRQWFDRGGTEASGVVGTFFAVKRR